MGEIEEKWIPPNERELAKIIEIGRTVKTINIAGMKLTEGDRVIVYTSLRNPPEELTFKAFNLHLFAFYFVDDDGREHIIPYKQIKRITKKS